jgi:hypothetical protein
MICGLPRRIKAPLMQQNHTASFTKTIPLRVVQNFCEKFSEKKARRKYFLGDGTLWKRGNHFGDEKVVKGRCMWAFIRGRGEKFGGGEKGRPF